MAILIEVPRCAAISLLLISRKRIRPGIDLQRRMKLTNAPGFLPDWRSVAVLAHSLEPDLGIPGRGLLDLSGLRISKITEIGPGDR